MTRLMKFKSAMARDPAVDDWLNKGDSELDLIARKWFAKLRECGDDVKELVHDGCPVACVDEAAFGYINTFTKHVNLGFFSGATLPDPCGVLEGTGKRMRHVKLWPGKEIEPKVLEALITSAYSDMKGQLEAE